MGSTKRELVAISEDSARHLYKNSLEEIFVVDDEGQESLIEGEEYFERFDKFALNARVIDDNDTYSEEVMYMENAFDGEIVTGDAVMATLVGQIKLQLSLDRFSKAISDFMEKYDTSLVITNVELIDDKAGKKLDIEFTPGELLTHNFDGDAETFGITGNISGLLNHDPLTAKIRVAMGGETVKILKTVYKDNEWSEMHFEGV